MKKVKRPLIEAASIAMLITLVLVAVSVSTSIASAQVTVTIEIGDATANITSGEITNTTAIIIKNVTDTDVGTATVNLTYDGSVVWVLNTTNSDFNVHGNEIHNDTGIGYTRISALQNVSGGMNGTVKLCDVALKAVGNPGGFSLNLTLEELKNVSGWDITCMVNNGTFTVTGGIKGDVDGNPGVTMIDAMYLAKHVVGLPGFETIGEYVADVDGNQGVTMIDAMYLAKHVVGLPGFEVLQ